MRSPCLFYFGTLCHVHPSLEPGHKAATRVLLQAATGHSSISQANHNVLKEFCAILQVSPGDTLGSPAREPGVMPASFHCFQRKCPQGVVVAHCSSWNNASGLRLKRSSWKIQIYIVCLWENKTVEVIYSI